MPRFPIPPRIWSPGRSERSSKRKKKRGRTPFFLWEKTYFETIASHLPRNVESAIFEHSDGSFLAMASSNAFRANAFDTSFVQAILTAASVTFEQAETSPVFVAAAMAASFKQYWRLVPVRPTQLPSPPESDPVVQRVALRAIQALHSFFKTGFVTFPQTAGSVVLPVRTSVRMS